MGLEHKHPLGSFRRTTSTRLSIRSRQFSIRIIPSRQRNDNIHHLQHLISFSPSSPFSCVRTYHQQRSLKVIRAPIAEEVTHHQNAQHHQRNHKDLEVEIQTLAQCPADDDDQRCVEESGLNTRPNAMKQREVLCLVSLYSPSPQVRKTLTIWLS